MIKNNFQSAYSIKNLKYSNFQDRIYHYTSAEGLIGILTKKKLWCTNIYFLNDNQELFYTYKIIKNVVEEISDSINKKLKESIIDRCDYMLSSKYFDHEKDVLGRREYYVASFSTDNDNISLWNYYTKSNVTGYNISFEPYLLAEDSFVKGLVCYNLDEQKEILKELILESNQEYNKNSDRDSIINDLWVNFIIYSLFFKDKHYEVEKEYRIVLSMMNHIDECNQCDYRTNNGLIIPYTTIDFRNCIEEKKQNEKIEYNNELIQEIKISPLNQGNISKYGVERICSANHINFVDVSLSNINMKF